MPRPKPPLPPGRSRLSGIYHRLTFLLGLGISAWVVLGYIGTKMRQARIKLVSDRERSERVKQHFTSTMSNITFTIYALIPTLASQILIHLDVEGTTEELSTLAALSSSSSSSAVGTGAGTGTGARKPATGTAREGMTGYSLPNSASEMTSQTSSTTLESDFTGAGGTGAREDQRDDHRDKREIGESWASEFVNASGEGEREQHPPRPEFSTDVSESSEDYREGQHGHSYQDETHPHHPHEGIETDPHAHPIHPFSTPASHSYALQSDMETSTDMSTSISNMTDPSLRSSSSEHDDQEDETTATGGRRVRSRSTGRVEGDNEHDREKAGDEALLSSPESRYLRSPSRSPRRSRSSGLPREQDQDRQDSMGDKGQGVMGAETSAPAGFSYADIVKVGSGGDHPVDEERREMVQTEKLGMGQSTSGRTKAQLWNDIKLQSITRTILTIYLVPLLAIHTTSQLTLLARLHHLRNLAELNSASEDPSSTETSDEPRPGSARSPRRSMFGKAVGEIGQLLKPWSYFSLESMGLDEYAGAEDSAPPLQDGLAGGVVSGLWSVGTSTASYLLGTGSKSASTKSARQGVQPLHMRLDLDTERTFLCFSWWLLHVGWKELEERVRPAVKLVFKSVSLKKELTVQDWLRLFDEVKNTVDQSLRRDDSAGVNGLHDLVFPPADPARFESLLIKHGLQDSCPIPAPPYASPLAELLDQTSSHILSADFEYLLSISIGKMKTTVLDQLASQIYDEIVLLDPMDSLDDDHARIESLKGKRLVECLPFLTTWSRGVWAKVPDEAIERTLGLSEMEGFASLIYADFGNDLVQESS